MAQQSSFFNAELVNGQPDRTYSATDWAEYFATFIGNGIALNPSTCLQVQASSNLSVIVADGVALINGYRYANTSPLTINLTPANGEYTRITSIVVELNLDTRNITCFAVDGVPSTNPQPPNLIRNGGVYQLLLANITVGAGATSLSQSNIVDMRNTEQCGYIRGLFGSQESRKVSQALASLQNEFNQIQNANYLTSSSSPTLINNWTLAEATNLQFQNSNGDVIIGIQVNDDNFMVFNNLTNNALYNVTPVTSGTDTVNWNADLYFGENVTMSEAGYLYFENSNGDNIITVQVNGSEFEISNTVTSNNLLTFTPVSSGTDTISVWCNVEFQNNISASTMSVSDTMTTNTLNVTNDYQSNGTSIWNTICNQSGTISVNGVDVNYTVVGWYMNSYSFSSAPQNTCGYFGVLGVNLTCNEGVDVSGSFTINLTGNPLSTNNMMWCMGNNVQDVQTEATYTDFYITGLSENSITISTYNGNTYNLTTEYIRLYITN